MSVAHVRLRLLLLALLASAAGASACDDTDQLERRVRIAVRSLAAAPPDKAPGELAKVVGHGRRALMEIEQVYQTADTKGRERLIRALQGIGSPEAIPLLRFLARSEDEPRLRSVSRAALRSLGVAAPKGAPASGDSSQPLKNNQ